MKKFEEFEQRLKGLQPEKKLEYHKESFLSKDRIEIGINNMGFTDYGFSEAVGISNYFNDDYPYFDICVSYEEFEEALNKSKTWDNFVTAISSLYSRKRCI